MAGTAVDAGKAFLDDVLKRSKIPADVQAAILADETILAGVGDGTLMRAEASRITDELNREKARLKDIADKQVAWHTSNEKTALVKEIEDLKARGPLHNPGGIDQKALDTRLETMGNDLEALGVGLTSMMTTIGLSHLKEFGETLDMEDLTKKAIAAKQPLRTFYAEMVAPERKKRADTDLTKRIADAEEKGRIAGRTEALNQRGPYPVGQGQGPSTLDGLRKPETGVKDDHTLAAAILTAETELAKELAKV